MASYNYEKADKLYKVSAKKRRLKVKKWITLLVIPSILLTVFGIFCIISSVYSNKNEGLSYNEKGNIDYKVYLKQNDFIDKIQTSKIDELYLIDDHYLNPYLNYIKDNKKLFKITLAKTETLNLNKTISPSCIIYSFPSERTSPFSLAATIDPSLIKSSYDTTSAFINPLSISE